MLPQILKRLSRISESKVKDTCYTWVLDTSLLNTWHYKVRINVEQSKERSSTFLYTAVFCFYWKGSLRVAHDYGHQLIYIYWMFPSKSYPVVVHYSSVKVKKKNRTLHDQTGPDWLLALHAQLLAARVTPVDYLKGIIINPPEVLTLHCNIFKTVFQFVIMQKISPIVIMLLFFIRAYTKFIPIFLFQVCLVSRTPMQAMKSLNINIY